MQLALDETISADPAETAGGARQRRYIRVGCPRLLWEAVSQSLLLGFEDDFRHPAVPGRRGVSVTVYRWPGERSVLYCPRPLVGWASHLARAVSQYFLMGCDEAFRSQQSGRAVSEAFPSQQVLAFCRARWLVFGPGEASLEGAWPRWAGCLPVLSYGFRR